MSSFEDFFKDGVKNQTPQKPAPQASSQSTTKQAKSVNVVSSPQPQPQPQTQVQVHARQPAKLKESLIQEALNKLKNGVPEPETENTLFGAPKRVTITVFGAKGTSKTTLSLYMALANSKGKVLVLTFESSATINTINQFFSKYKDRIDVIPLDQLYDFKNPQEMLEGMSKVIDAMFELLTEARATPYSWIIVEGLQELNRVAEGKMRYMNQIDAFAGFKNLNLWKERNLYIKQLFNLLHGASRNGVIFTSHEIITEAEEGNRREPAWLGIVKERTDVTLETRKNATFEGVRFFVIVRDDKINGSTGTVEVTNNPRAIVDFFRSATKSFEIDL